MKAPGSQYGFVISLLFGLMLLFVSTDVSAQQADSLQTRDWERQLERLLAVPYVGLSETEVDERDTSVTRYREDKSYYGYNFYCTRGSSKATLMDMNGHVVHQWCFDFDEEKCHCKLAILLDKGDLFGISNNKKVFLLNWDSELIWEKPLRAHHDMSQASDGSFFVLTQEMKEHRGSKVRFDDIIHLSPDGEVLDQWSSCDHLEELGEKLDTRSFLDVILDSIDAGQSQEDGDKKPISKDIKSVRIDNPLRDLDYFHMNTMHLLPATELGERDSRFREGNLLVCFRNVNQIAVLERDTYRVLWAWGEGELQWPHDPTMLDNGHILIFDNGIERQYSRILELDPETETIAWEYTDKPPENFYSPKQGSAQRLPNGNTLICASGNGRVFEVDPTGRKVWVWSNPDTHRNHPEIIFRMRRLPPAFVDRLLDKAEDLKHSINEQR